MNTYARVFEGVVREVLQAESLPEFHPDITAQFYDVTQLPGVAQGWTYENGLFQAPVIPDPEPLPLPDQLLSYLQAAAQQISTEIANGAEAPPTGTFTTIAQISLALQEVAKLVPPELYAPEANKAITDLGVLPEPLEDFRQGLLTLLAGALE